MGSASTKFRKYLQNGDEYAAMQVFQSSNDLQRSLDPNMSYGDAYQHNTPLHLTAKHAMKHLLRTFLNDLSGNPNKKNIRNETSLHVACQVSQTKSLSAQERRGACVLLVLQWRGLVMANGEVEKADVSALDEKENTPLHYAALSGLKKCVELLVAHGSPLFAENDEKQTPCDCAEQAGHEDIALFLESRMVFADGSDTVNEADIMAGLELPEAYNGLRAQDLQEAKDQLLVETSDMLRVPLFTAEALLRDNEWSREALLDSWMRDPVACCEKAGVQPPASALQYHARVGGDSDSGEESLNSPVRTTPLDAETMCDICALYMAAYEEPVPAACDHLFCRSCWEKYLTVKIQAGDAHIACPAYGCSRLVPADIIERLVSPDMVRRYLQFDIKAFVESNPHIKWCPFPGCGRAVCLPDPEYQQQQTDFVNTRNPSAMPTSHAVDCGNGHYFCWECLGEAHAPCCCHKWNEWQEKVAEVKPEELKSSGVETEAAANCLWLVTNSKPCPNCKSPIQKNEGCNHMKCSKCKFDFCWVCLEAWKKHSSATGGYFRCNRYEAVHRVEDQHGVLISVAEMRNQQMQELNRFVHFYTRFRNHENSRKMEEPLLKTARDKMMVLATSMPDLAGSSAEVETRFVEDAVGELLKSRKVLCGSYVYGYYLEDNGYNKAIFEFMQNELEDCTEKLAQMVARPYLRTPRSQIMQTTSLVKRRRQEFVTAVSKGLIPPETPPSMRRFRRKRLPGSEVTADDEQLSQAIAASLRDLAPTKPWVRDKRSDLAALYDYDSDEDAQVHHALAVSILDPVTSYPSDYQMELLVALEMSRLQMIQDMERQRLAQGDACIVSASASSESPGTKTTSSAAFENEIQMCEGKTTADATEPLQASSAVQSVGGFLNSTLEYDEDEVSYAYISRIPPCETVTIEKPSRHHHHHQHLHHALTIRSSSTGSLEQHAAEAALPDHSSGRLTASTGNLTTGNSCTDWESSAAGVATLRSRLMRQSSEGVATTTTTASSPSLAFCCHDYEDDDDDDESSSPAHRRMSSSTPTLRGGGGGGGGGGDKRHQSPRLCSRLVASVGDVHHPPRRPSPATGGDWHSLERLPWRLYSFSSSRERPTSSLRRALLQWHLFL